MFANLAIIVFVTIQLSNGIPLESAEPEYDVKSFFSSRIVGGEDAPKGHFTYMVALVYGQYFRMLVCGGAIITKRHVLTAAHCVDPFVYWNGELSQTLRGVVGTNYWNSTYTEIRFCGYRNHPDWDWSTIKNDIGILITAHEIRFSKMVTPIPGNSEWIGGGQRATVAGWGRIGLWKDVPDRLQMLDVTVLSCEECYARMQLALETLGPAPPVDCELEICTLHSKGYGMCHGDSGSPLVMARMDRGKEIRQHACALGAPDMFVRVSTYTTFIVETVRTRNVC